jgi:signal transduction histidine kinase
MSGTHPLHPFQEQRRTNILRPLDTIRSWWPPHVMRRRLAQEPGEALFRGIHLRLTLWYCAVLGTALVLFGVALYVGTRYALLNPITAAAQFHAQGHANQWLSGSHNACSSLDHPDQADSPGLNQGQGFFTSELIVCFDQSGTLLPQEDTTGLPSAFLSNTVARAALQSSTGSASDTVDAGNSSGKIYRYALLVSSPTGNGVLGVVVVGESVEAQEDALASLLKLLLTIGGGALLCAGLGGLFLANRALAPARLAWENQQRFIGDASHELRTPLTLLRADAEVLLRGRERLDPEDALLLEDIVTETNHMTTITTNLLTLARLDSQRAHREHEVIHFAQLVHREVRRVQALAQERTVTIQEEQRGDPLVIGDSPLLEQAMLVLLENAIKYNRQGGQVFVRTEEQHGQARVQVRDTGIGIAAEHLPHLGKRFYRVDKARSRQAGGTGLGLSIAQSIVREHGGQLTIASLPDQGTTVTLLLPLVHGAQSRAPLSESELP